MKRNQNRESSGYHIIGYSLLKARAIPLLLLFSAVMITSIWGYNRNMLYFGYMLTAISICAYFIIGLRYRFEKNLRKPSEHIVYFPLAGKISSIKEVGAKTIISVQKSTLDFIDIRSPHALCRRETGDLIIDEIELKITFTEGKIKTFEEESFKAGNIIGMAQGKVYYTVELSAEQDINLSVGQELKAGSSVLTMLEYAPIIEVIDTTIPADEEG